VLNAYFDDARYALALLEKNARHFESALEQLHAIKVIPPVREYSYWTAIADACNELDNVTRPSQQRKKLRSTLPLPPSARSPRNWRTWRKRISRWGFRAMPNGRQQMVTTRIPHNATNWNPFIEPGDDMRSVQGTLREIECGEKGMRILVDTAAGPLKLAIPDPSHVQMRNAPAEFTCGPQAGVSDCGIRGYEGFGKWEWDCQRLGVQVEKSRESSTIRLRHVLIQATVKAWPRLRASIRLFATSRQLR